ncbi:amidase [Pseudohalocynthiibacter aestuariivivens]|nr:amidase [Pseudohalocynthiibacter aestuariivivens]QIE44766.1 amidase [Pseudohalocynthiibacter aestuariivivens]
MDDVLALGARAQITAIVSGRLSAEDLMRASLTRIESANGPANAIVSMRSADDLMAEARSADRAEARGPLHGLPVAIKDLANARGLPTSQGSPLFAGQMADADDLHVARMRAAGAIIIGKTNTPEFGLGSQTFNQVFGVTPNPYDADRTCGGSSGGAAVALAYGMVSLADGSDMMGSLRNPAGWCNVYGMRPSWGVVPGEVRGDTFLHQISTNGPMARSPDDLKLLLEVMAGPDPRQPHGRALEPAHGAGRRIGWLGDWGGMMSFEPGILALCEAALEAIDGAEVDALTAPFARDALWQSWTDLRSWAVGASLAPMMADETMRARLKPEAVWEAERGAAMSAMRVHRASVTRSEWFMAADALFERYDVLAMPTAQVWPFGHDQAWPKTINGVEMDSYHRWMECVVPASLIGLPVVAVPAGFGGNGLPMGMQLIGRRGADRDLLALAETYHRATGWPQARPPQS